MLRNPDRLAAARRLRNHPSPGAAARSSESSETSLELVCQTSFGVNWFDRTGLRLLCPAMSLVAKAAAICEELGLPPNLT